MQSLNYSYPLIKEPIPSLICLTSETSNSSHVDLIGQDACDSVENGRKKGPGKGVLRVYWPNREPGGGGGGGVPCLYWQPSVLAAIR